MQKLAVLLASTLAVSLGAQCTPATVTTNLSGGNQGNTGGGIYFDITVNSPIRITDINFRAGPTGSGGTSQMRIWMGPTTWVGNVTNPALWTEVRQTAATNIVQNATTANPGILTPGQLVDPVTQQPAPMELLPGSYGIALQSTLNVFNHGYSNTPPGPWSDPNNQLVITTGAAQNAFLSGGIFQPRHWNGEIVFDCNLSGQFLSVASSETYGDGCYGWYTSFHELFPNPTGLDVANQTVELTANLGNSTYDVGPGLGVYTAPTASAIMAPPLSGTGQFSVAGLLGGPLPFPIFYPRGGSLGIADDLEVCISGFITPVDVGTNGTSAALPGANAPDTSPTPAELYGGAERWCPHWKTMTSATSGTVSVEVLGSPGTQQLVIDWTAVSSNTFQIVFNEASGNVEYRYLGMSQGGGGGQPVIIGWSQGNGALPRGVNISDNGVPTSFSTQPVDNTPLSIALDNRPQLGTSVNVVVDGYDPATTPVAAFTFDLVQQVGGLTLQPIGMPGCTQYIGSSLGQVMAVSLLLPGGMAPVTRPLIPGGIPNNPSFNALVIYGQAFSLTGNCAGGPCNALGALASPGMRIFFGQL